MPLACLPLRPHHVLVLHTLCMALPSSWDSDLEGGPVCALVPPSVTWPCHVPPASLDLRAILNSPRRAGSPASQSAHSGPREAGTSPAEGQPPCCAPHLLLSGELSPLALAAPCSGTVTPKCPRPVSLFPLLCWSAHPHWLHHCSLLTRVPCPLLLRAPSPRPHGSSVSALGLATGPSHPVSCRGRAGTEDAGATLARWAVSDHRGATEFSGLQVTAPRTTTLQARGWGGEGPGGPPASAWWAAVKELLVGGRANRQRLCVLLPRPKRAEGKCAAPVLLEFPDVLEERDLHTAHQVDRGVQRQTPRCLGVTGSSGGTVPGGRHSKPRVSLLWLL